MQKVVDKTSPKDIDEATITRVSGGPQGQRRVVMSKVFVLDTNKQPLAPVHPGRARHLLTSGQAAVFRRYPFTIILKYAASVSPESSYRLKLDPGSRTTGIALLHEQAGEVVFAAQLTHRGQAIKKALDDRRAIRRSRRNRHTRYRQPRFLNRRRKEGWLPPSLESRLANTLTWVKRLMRFCPISALSLELIKFDMQAMQHPEISGVEYQQGDLAGYEVREYLLEKWNRQCAYCGRKNVPLQVEHIQSRARGGSNRVSNLTLACEACNLAKGTQDIREFLIRQPETLRRILAQAKAPLKDAAALNTSRWALYRQLQVLGLPLEIGTGGRTKYNRVNRGLTKTHWVDAACVGASTPEALQVKGVCPLLIKATGSGTRQMCQTDKFGFPKQYRKRQKRYYGFQTGDMVRVHIPRGKHAGTYLTRITVRASGSFKFRTTQSEISCSYRYCTPIHRCDGYHYEYGSPGLGQ